MPYGRFSMGMSMLLTGLLSLCLTCGPSVHPATTQAIIEVESAGKPLAIHDNTTGISYNPTTRSEAVALTADLLHHGHSLDIGLMQINSQHLKNRSINYKGLFDPCFNIKTGTTILSEFYHRHSRNNPKDPPDLILLKSLSSYNTGTPYRGKYYVTKLLTKAGIKVDDSIIAQHETRVAKRTPGTLRTFAYFKKETTN